MPTKKTTVKKQRLQFDFTPEAVKDIDELGKKIAAANRAEVVRRALHLMKSCVNGDARIFRKLDDGSIIPADFMF